MTPEIDSDFATVEVARTDCFLCRPATREARGMDRVHVSAMGHDAAAKRDGIDCRRSHC